MGQEFSDSWRTWTRLNVGRGCSKDGIFKILLDEGFDYDLIKEELHYEPRVDIGQLVNPLKPFLGEALVVPDTGVDPSQVDFTRVFVPNGARVVSDCVELYEVEDFLNETECLQMGELIRANLRPSTITNNSEPDQTFRTSMTCDLGNVRDPLVQDLDRRICRFLGFNPAYSESLQGQYYWVGQEFKPHTDSFEPSEMQRYAGKNGQRTWTFMVYLNDTKRGGETRFVNLNRSFKPRRGTALTWCNLNSDGCPNPQTLHQGMPVLEGYKAIITKWFRARGEGEMFVTEASERLPIYTREGFDRRKAPTVLFEKLAAYYRDHSAEAVKESVPGFIDAPHDRGSELIPLPARLKKEVHEALRPTVETWCGIQLESTHVYGIRRYLRDATLALQRDRIATHLLSAVVNIDQRVEEEWPLAIEDHLCRAHDVFLAPGEMLLYEGGRLLHGRPRPLQGESYANVFVHYRPRGVNHG